MGDRRLTKFHVFPEAHHPMGGHNPSFSFIMCTSRLLAGDQPPGNYRILQLIHPRTLKPASVALTGEIFFMIQGARMDSSALVGDYLHANLDVHYLAPLPSEYLLLPTFLEVQAKGGTSLSDLLTQTQAGQRLSTANLSQDFWEKQVCKIADQKSGLWVLNPQRVVEQATHVFVEAFGQLGDSHRFPIFSTQIRDSQFKSDMAEMLSAYLPASMEKLFFDQLSLTQRKPVCPRDLSQFFQAK